MSLSRNSCNQIQCEPSHGNARLIMLLKILMDKVF
jgi:hypothetical protein